MSKLRSFVVTIALVGAAIQACAGDGPVGSERPSSVVLNFLTPATVRVITVTVSGPGISPAVTRNITVGTDSTARDTIVVTAGAGRRFVFSAFDTAGVETHRADTTIRLLAGVNAPLAIRLVSLSASVGVTVTFGGARLSVSDTSTRSIATGDTARITASALAPNGAAVPADSLVWASSNPAVAVVSGGLVRGVRAGTALVSASWRGTAVRIPVLVTGTVGAPTGRLLLRRGNGSSAYSGDLLLAPVGGSSTLLFTRDLIHFPTLAAANGSVVLGVVYDNGIFRRDAPYNTETRLLTGINYWMRKSPDGRFLVWARDTGCGGSCEELFLSDSAFNPVRLTNNSDHDWQPTMTPDNRLVIFVRTTTTTSGSSNTIRSLAIASGAEVQLTSSGSDLGPGVSPDGTKIAFTSARDGARAVYVMNADGTDVRRLPRVPDGVTIAEYVDGGASVHWSPDGAYLAFNAGDANGIKTWIVRADGSSNPFRATESSLKWEFVFGWVP